MCMVVDVIFFHRLVDVQYLFLLVVDSHVFVMTHRYANLVNCELAEDHLVDCVFLNCLIPFNDFHF